MMGNGLESGVVLCAIYDDKNKPLEGNADIRKTTFEDGTEILYNRKNKCLEIKCEGDIKIHAKGNVNITADGNMKHQAARIDLN